MVTWLPRFKPGRCRHLERWWTLFHSREQTAERVTSPFQSLSIFFFASYFFWFLSVCLSPPPLFFLSEQKCEICKWRFCLFVFLSKAFEHIVTCLAIYRWVHFPSSFLNDPPEGRPRMSDVSPLSGISGLSFDSTLLSPLLFFCLVLLPFLSYRFLPAGPFF